MTWMQTKHDNENHWNENKHKADGSSSILFLSLELPYLTTQYGNVLPNTNDGNWS